MKKMSEDVVIHCSKEIEAKKLLMFLKSEGYKWKSGASIEPSNSCYLEHPNCTRYLVCLDKSVSVGIWNLDYPEYEYSDFFDSNENVPDNPVEIRLESYSPRIKKMAIKCPYCNSWFRYIDMIDERATRKMSESQIYGAVCNCPKCDEQFIIENAEIERPEDGSDIYKDCLKRKKIEIWE